MTGFTWEEGRGGILKEAVQYSSPNFDARPEGSSISLAVIHFISLPPNVFGGDDVLALFSNTLDPNADSFYPEIVHLRVSAHFFIRRTGELVQLVPCDQRAWHAGLSSWKGQQRCNDFSIGIELEGCGTVPFEGEQYETLVTLIRTLKARYPIQDVVGHEHIAPGRKDDPGPCFDWACLAGI